MCNDPKMPKNNILTVNIKKVGTKPKWQCNNELLDWLPQKVTSILAHDECDKGNLTVNNSELDREITFDRRVSLLHLHAITYIHNGKVERYKK